MQMQILAALLFVCVRATSCEDELSQPSGWALSHWKSLTKGTNCGPASFWKLWLWSNLNLFFLPLHQFLWHWHWCCCWPRLQLLAVVASAAPLGAWPGLVASTPPPVHSTCLLHILPAYLSPAPNLLCGHWLDCQQWYTWPLPWRLNWPAQCISCLPTFCPNNICVKRQRSSSCDHWQSCRFH